MTPQQWWILDQLKRKRAHYESDQRRARLLLERAPDEPTRRRLQRELEFIEANLAKLDRGWPF